MPGLRPHDAGRDAVAIRRDRRVVGRQVWAVAARRGVTPCPWHRPFLHQQALDVKKR